MRIIAGTAKGIQLKSPPAEVRPPTDRIKEAIFSTLEPFEGLTVVDLFSGSGSVGLEALSRGASAVYMVEKLRRNAEVINQNLNAVRKAIGQTAATAQIVVGDATKVGLILKHVQPDIVMADPPFFPKSDQAGAVDLLSSKSFHTWLGEGLLELRQSIRHAPFPEGPPFWKILRTKKYGESIVYYMQAIS